MSPSASRFLRVIAPFGAAAALGMGSLTALAQTAPTTTGDCSGIHFELANPTPGARVELGADVIQGIALDTRAPSGSVGIDRVDFFLDSRDAGGINIGSALPGTTPGPFGPGSFQTVVTLPNMVGGHDLVAYAHDTVTNQESVISVPIALGEDPSLAFTTTSVPSTGTEMCTGTSETTTTTPATAAATPAATSPSTTQPSATTTTTTTGSPAASTITLDVGNPSPGSTVHVGAYVIDGRAFDSSAQSGSGIDRIDIFLDSRDAGGMLLGQATLGDNNLWSATVTLPSNQTGLHTLSFYAHSSVTGQEMVVSVPVSIAP